MKYSTSTVLAAVGAATVVSADGTWGTWDPEATTTTASSKWAWPATTATTSSGKVWDPTGKWDPKKSSTTTTAATEWPEWTTSADPEWTSSADPAETSSWASWDPVDPVDPAQCSQYSTSTVWADPSGAWGAFPTTLIETDTVSSCIFKASPLANLSKRSLSGLDPTDLNQLSSRPDGVQTRLGLVPGLVLLQRPLLSEEDHGVVNGQQIPQSP